jgi:uncharacterized membrane protein YozB (DUF420 family)
MGLTTSNTGWLLFRAWLAGTAIAFGPLLVLEETDYLVRDFLPFSLKFWPDWAAIPISMAFGAVAAGWVARRRGWEAAPRLEIAAQRITGHLLFFILSVYALSKVLRTQFRVPYVVLDTPLGDVSGYMLAWRFLGFSHFHEMFVAVGEFLGPVLLLFWRTLTLGALITAVVMTNVVLVNFTHQLPVRWFSSCLLALTIYLLLLDGRRLLGFFVLNQSVAPRPRPAPLIRSGVLRAAFKAGWVALALAYSFLYIGYGDSKPSPLAGAWRVEHSGQTASVPWHAVYFERGFYGSFPGSVRREAGAKPERFTYEFDAGTRHLKMKFPDSAGGGKVFDGSYELDGDRRLRLHGSFDEKAVDLELTRKH